MGDKFDLGNAHISGSAIGNRATVNNYGAAPDVLLTALLSRRCDRRGGAPPHGRHDRRARLGELEGPRRRGKPAHEVVRTGWQRIAGVVGVLSEPVMEVTKLTAKFLA